MLTKAWVNSLNLDLPFSLQWWIFLRPFAKLGTSIYYLKSCFYKKKTFQTIMKDPQTSLLQKNSRKNCQTWTSEIISSLWHSRQNIFFVVSVEVFRLKVFMEKRQGMAQDKFPSKLRKIARSEKSIFCGISDHDKFVSPLLYRSWKCSSMDNLLMQYWACSCKIHVSYLQRLPVRIETQKIFLQNIDITCCEDNFCIKTVAWNGNKFIKEVERVPSAIKLYVLHLPESWDLRGSASVWKYLDLR